MTIDSRYLTKDPAHFSEGSSPDFALQLANPGGTSPYPKTHSKAGFSPFSTSSTSYVDVTGAAITKSTQAAKCGILVTLPVDNSANSFSFRITIDGTPATDSDFDDVTQTDNGITHLFFLTDSLTAASHLFQLQVKSVTGGSVALGAGDIIVFEMATDFQGLRTRFSSFSTASTSYVDVTGSDVVITNHERNLLFNATFPINNLTSSFSLRLTRNGVPIAGTDIVDTTNLKNGLVSVTWLLRNIPKVANTFKLQVKRTAGSDTLVLGAGNLTGIEQSESLRQAGGQVGGIETTSSSYVDIDGSGITIGGGSDRAYTIDTTEGTSPGASGPYGGGYAGATDTTASITKAYAGTALLYLVSYYDSNSGAGLSEIDADGTLKQIGFLRANGIGQNATQKAQLITGAGTGSKTFRTAFTGYSGTDIQKMLGHLLELPEKDDSLNTLGYIDFEATTSQHLISSGLTFSNIPTWTMTQTFSGGQALIFVSFEKSGATNPDYPGRYRIAIDGVGQSREYISLRDTNDWMTMVYLVTVTAGSHTITLQARHDNSNSLNPGTTEGYMFASELPAVIEGLTKQYIDSGPGSDPSFSSGSMTEIYTTGSIAINNTGRRMIWITFDVDATANLGFQFQIKIDGVVKQLWDAAATTSGATYRRSSMAVVHMTDADISSGSHTFSIEAMVNTGSGTVTLYNLRLLNLEMAFDVISVSDSGNSTVITVPTTQDKALVSYSAPIKNLNSNYALQLLVNGTAITNSEVTDTTGNSDGMVTIAGLTNSLTDGDNIFKAQIKRTSGSDTIKVYKGQWSVNELPDQQNVGPGLIDIGSQVEQVEKRDAILIGEGMRNPAAVFQVNSTERGWMGKPRMTTTQRDAMTVEYAFDTGMAGLEIYNTTTNKQNFWNGSAWEVVTSS